MSNEIIYVSRALFMTEISTRPLKGQIIHSIVRNYKDYKSVVKHEDLQGLLR